MVVYQIVHEPRGPQADSLIQPGPVYSHLELYLGQTEDETRRVWAGQAAVRAGGSRGFARWFPPAVAPEAATLRSPFPRRQLATFVQGRERLQDVEWAGVSGFDDMGETPLATAGGQVLFHVLEPPQQIFFFNGPQRFEVSIPRVTRASGVGGALIAVDLDPLMGVFVSRVTAVPVFAANDLATRLFDAAHPTRDNLDQLRGYMHVRRMRWVRPENVEVIP